MVIKTGAFRVRGFIMALFFLPSIVFFGNTALAFESPFYTDLGQMNYARFLMHGGEYRTAAREFERVIESFPGSPVLVEAQFGLSEAYYMAGLYDKAEVQYRQFVRNFGESPLAGKALVRLDELGWMRVKRLPTIPLPEAPFRQVKGLKAVQVMLFEGRTIEEVEGELKGLGSAGVDTVILRVFHNSGDRFYRFVSPRDKRGVYFNTSSAPVVDDMLSAVLTAAHRQGLKVFAWMTTRYADYGVEDDEDLACTGYDIRSKGFVRCKGLDLFNERAIERLERIYADLAEYEIDGVLFQDDLVLRHSEGFGAHMEALFKKETGVEMDPESLYLTDGRSVHYTELFWKWASWKNRRLLDVAGRLKEVVAKKRPEARFAINLMYESVTNAPYALAWLSQDLAEAARRDFDYYSIMAYHRQMGTELKRDPEEIRDIIERMVVDASASVGPEKVLIKVQTIDWSSGEALPDDEVAGILKSVRAKESVSLAVVPYRKDLPLKELAGGGSGADAAATSKEEGI